MDRGFQLNGENGPGLSELEGIAALKLGLIDLLAIEEETVGATEVLDPPAPLMGRELGVDTADLGMVEL